MAEVKLDTHIVVKNEDVTKYLGTEEADTFYKLSSKILSRRLKNGRSVGYHVCNCDEPYADEVHNLILMGEDAYANDCVPEEGWEFVAPEPKDPNAGKGDETEEPIIEEETDPDEEDEKVEEAEEAEEITDNEK